MSDSNLRKPNKPAALGLVALILSLSAWYVAWLPYQERRQPVDEAEQQQLNEQTELNTLQLQDMITEQLSSRQLADERERQESSLGQELSLRCLQWTDLNDTQPSENTLRFQEQACKRYNHYVTTGELLPNDDE